MFLSLIIAPRVQKHILRWWSFRIAITTAPTARWRSLSVGTFAAVSALESIGALSRGAPCGVRPVLGHKVGVLDTGGEQLALQILFPAQALA